MSCKSGRRIPQCARCRSHDTFSSVRGHKRVCKWKDCTCEKCIMVTEKRRVTAARVAVLRRERKRRISHRMNFQFGAAPGARGMMESVPGNYTTEQFIDNRRMLVQNENFRSDMFHMAYRPMYPYDTEYLQYPSLQPRTNELVKTEGDTINNITHFEYEYESLMRQQSENDEMGDPPPNNETPMQVSNHSVPSFHPNGHQKIFAPQTRMPFYVNGPGITHGDPYQSQVSQQTPGFLPMVLNSPCILPCPYSIKPSHGIPFRVGF